MFVYKIRSIFMLPGSKNYEKNEKRITDIESTICNSPVFFLSDFYLNCQGHYGETLASWKRWERAENAFDFYRGWYSASNGITVNVVLRWHLPKF